MLALKTYQMPWKNLGTITETVADDDATFTVAERDYVTAIALTNVVYCSPVPSPINTVEVKFAGTTNGADFKYIDVWAGRRGGEKNCDLSRVCTLDVEVGTQDLVYTGSTLHYADEITITNDNWLKTVSAIQSGNDTDRIARLIFDLCGYDTLVFHGYGTGWGGVDAHVFISGY